MKRRRAREYALQILFQLELSGIACSEEVFDAFWEGNDEDSEVKSFTHDIVFSTSANIDKIDGIIQKAAEHWALARMAVIDRNILRAATYEMLFRTDIPTSVVINEALEIAKKYSTEESASFINGILDKISRDSAVSTDRGN
jgi:N utilization substance protein B